MRYRLRTLLSWLGRDCHAVSADPHGPAACEGESWIDPFTDRAKTALSRASKEARRLNHCYVGTEHLLLALLDEGSGVAAAVLEKMSGDKGKIQREMKRLTIRETEGVLAGRLPLTPLAKRAIDYAREEARNLNQGVVGTEHLLLGLLREWDSVPVQLLLGFGMGPNAVRHEIMSFLGID